MGRKAGKFKRKENDEIAKKKSVRFDSDNEDMMEDEIDAFHKNRDVIPLNINEDVEESDEDNEQPVFDIEDDKDENDEDDDTDEDDTPPKGLAAKIVRTQKYLQAKFGGVDDEMLDDAEEEDDEMVVRRKKDLYGADVDEPQSSDDEDAADELAEVLKLQKEKAKVLSMEDFGLEDTIEDESDREPTFEEILDHGKPTSKRSLEKVIKDEDGMVYEIVKKDVNALTKEEQMDVVYSSAPELIGLLSELNDALEQLENKVNPLVDKIRGQESAKKGGMHYMEVKQLLLQSFCQAITFYLLLKSEGQPVRDHPVVSRLVEIKSLLDKIKEMDDNLPFDMEDYLKKEVINTSVSKLVEKTAHIESDSRNNGQIYPTVSSRKQARVEQPSKEIDLNTLKSSKNNKSQQKQQDKQCGPQNTEMLKIRASLEEKLKQKGLFSSIEPKSVRTREQLQPMNRQLETLDDFVDEAMEIDSLANGRSNGDANLSHSSKISQQLSLHRNKRKVVCGDDDIPKRDDIGERRRKHELRVLAGAGIKSADDDDGDETGNFSSDGVSDANEENETDSDLEFYKEVERQHAAKLAAKSDKYSRTPEVPVLPETADGKRHITTQILKNRGLTRARKKLIKNPRKKYKLKHQKAEVRRKGQVRAIRKPAGNYGGETAGINVGISHSVRFKN